eukprot:SM016079S02403  [mRNA]  locus=s16079:98:223:+ [translate_table: standard]
MMGGPCCSRLWRRWRLARCLSRRPSAQPRTGYSRSIRPLQRA